MKSSGRISYKILVPKPEKPAPATVWIIRAYGSGSDKDGDTLLSAGLMSAVEIDQCVNDLKKNLDDIGRRAKQALREANKRQK